RTPGQVVLSPSKEVARNGSAISDEGSVQKHAVVQRVGDRRQTQLEVTPGLLKTAAQHEIRYQILQRVKKRDAAEAGVRDVRGGRGPANACRAGRKGCRRCGQRRTGTRRRNLVGIGEIRSERSGGARSRSLDAK